MWFRKILILFVFLLGGIVSATSNDLPKSESDPAFNTQDEWSSSFISHSLPLPAKEKDLPFPAEKKEEEDDDETKELVFFFLIASHSLDIDTNAFNEEAFKNHQKAFLPFKSRMIGYSVFRL